MGMGGTILQDIANLTVHPDIDAKGLQGHFANPYEQSQSGVLPVFLKNAVGTHALGVF